MGHSLVLPPINQKKNLSNSGRNIVLSNSHYLDRESNSRENLNYNQMSNSMHYGNFTNFENNLSNKGKEKEKLDYEISKLEDQYKDILSKFTYLSKKRDLMN